jgi:hypothetical protein
MQTELNEELTVHIRRAKDQKDRADITGKKIVSKENYLGDPPKSIK